MPRIFVHIGHYEVGDRPKLHASSPYHIEIDFSVLPHGFTVGTIMSVEISYDPAKNAANIERRGLSFEQVAELDWSSAVISEDTRKTYAERRFRVFGYIGERLYAMVFTPRGSAVHVISFRKANSREVKRYG